MIIIECSPTPAGKEHDHEVNIEGSCARLLPSIICRKFEGKNITILELKQEVTVEKNKVKDAIKKIDELQNPSKRKNRFSIPEVKDSKRFAMFYASLQNHGVFMWIYNRIHKKVVKLQYFSRDSSFTSKNYQTSENKRIIGKKPSLFIENCLFLTLIRLRVGLTETDLAFCFQVSQLLLRILAKWISSLSQELSKGRCTPVLSRCFKGYKNVVGNTDCSKGILEKTRVVE